MLYNNLIELKEILEELNIRPKKSRGQNFLLNPSSISKICDFANITSTDNVLEIGPGIGAISQYLLEKSQNYFAVEIEQNFVNFLLSRLKDLKNGHIFNFDIREFVLSEHIAESYMPLTLVSNVPYSLSTEVIFWIIKNSKYIKSASLLLQREFVERLCAKPGNKEYGSITVATSLFAKTKLGPVINGESFYPKAEVESRLVQLELSAEPKFEVRSLAHFEKVVRGAFSTRRKTLLNALANAKISVDKKEILQCLELAEIDFSRRAETLTLEEFVRLANVISENLLR